MDERVVRGVPWTLLTFALPKLVGVLTAVVLARLLVPADFGLLALAVLTIGAFSLLGDFGLNNMLIASKEADERLKGTVLTLSLVLGAIVAAVTAATAPLAAAALDEPRLDGVLFALAPTTVLSAPGWFHQAAMQRELMFRKRFAGQLAQVLVQAPVSIVLAALGAGVWSLVIGYIASCAALTVASTALSPYRSRLTLDRASARVAILESRGFLAQGSASYVSQNADYFAVGAFVGSTGLGYYSMAYRLAELTPKAVADPVGAATFPGFAQMRREGQDFAAAFPSVLRSVASVGCPVAVILSGAADPFTRTVLGEQWLPMIGALAVLSVWAAVRVIQVTLAWYLNSVGHAGLTGAAAGAMLVMLIPGVVIAADRGDITVVSWVMVAHMVLSLALLSAVVAAKARVSPASQLRALRPILFACPVAWAATRGVATGLDGAAPALGLAACVAAGAAAYVAVAVTADPGLPRELAALARRALRPA